VTRRRGKPVNSHIPIARNRLKNIRKILGYDNYQPDPDRLTSVEIF
jgi:hypothetical protein